MLKSERSDSCISFSGVWQSATGESGSGRTALRHVQILHGRFLCMRTRRAVVQHAKAPGEVAAGGIEAAGVGADCSGMVTDCSGEGSISGSIMAAALGEPYIVQHGEGATAI